MERHSKAAATIKTWAQANGFDAAIWTALASNFHEPDKAGEPFSVEAAIRYLEMLDAPRLGAAVSLKNMLKDATKSERARENRIAHGFLIDAATSPAPRSPTSGSRKMRRATSCCN